MKKLRKSIALVAAAAALSVLPLGLVASESRADDSAISVAKPVLKGAVVTPCGQGDWPYKR